MPRATSQGLITTSTSHPQSTSGFSFHAGLQPPRTFSRKQLDYTLDYTHVQQASPMPATSHSRIEVDGDGSIEACNGVPAPVPMPEGSSAWTTFEQDLFLLSSGVYNPSKMALRRRLKVPAGFVGTGANLEVKGRVSIVTPTMDTRQHFHEQLWHCFEAQDWPDKELIVIEGYTDEPSLFLRQKAKEDSRLVHVCFQCRRDEDSSVGLKRNMTLHLASGEHIVNFDDDDLYAPNYCSKLVGEMRRKGLVGITLGTWYNYFVNTGLVGYSDPQVIWNKNMDDEEMDEVLYGYGFSYAHTRSVALCHPYPDVEFAEDAPFFIRLKEVFGEGRVILRNDEEGLCMHCVHRANSAGDMPIVRQVGAGDLQKLAVAPLFQWYIERLMSEPFLRRAERTVLARFDLAVESFWSLGSSGVWGLDTRCDQEADPHASSHRRVKSC